MSVEEIAKWVTLGLTVVGILGGLAWLLYFGRKVRLPEGRSFRRRTKHVAVDIVFWPRFAGMPEVMVRKTMDAIRATLGAWEAAGRSYDVDHVVVFYEDSDQFDRNPQSKTWAAYVGRARQSVGAAPPMLIVRDTHSNEVERTGEPVIHEMLHVLEGGDGYDYDHQDREIWKAHGKKTIQAEAGRRFVRITTIPPPA
jgi:hypothetical protein